MLTMLLSVGAYVGVVAALGFGVVLLAREERFEREIGEDDR